MIHHIELYVSDLKASKKFYSKLFSLLNYKIYQEWDKGFSYKQDTFYIVFVQVEEKYQINKYHRKNVGLNHLAFVVNDNQMVDNIRDVLKANGVKELYEDKYPFAGGKEHCAFYFEDPDRIKLEIVAEKII